MKRLVQIVLLLAFVMATPANASAKLPKVLTQLAKHPFQARPAVIAYTGDGTGIVGGLDGSDARDHLGRIYWSTYTHRQAVGVGLVWIDDCDPDCADGTFTSVPVRIHAFSPKHRHFRRLTLKYTYQGHAATDKRGIRHYTDGAGASYWAYYIISFS